jgi:hypothetical protein
MSGKEKEKRLDMTDKERKTQRDKYIKNVPILFKTITDV